MSRDTPQTVDELGTWLKDNNASLSMYNNGVKWHGFWWSEPEKP
jgi:hypothetical protein